IGRGECDAALAGGVSLYLDPVVYVRLCKMNALAKDGRSKAFDISADGYGRSEGAALLLLKKLSAAEADHDRILGVVRGSVINGDGRGDSAGAGLTVPNGCAQAALVLQTLKQAGAAPRDIGLVEAHGTGTPTGDPIEMEALCSVFTGTGAPDEPLFITSIKA